MARAHCWAGTSSSPWRSATPISSTRRTSPTRRTCDFSWGLPSTGWSSVSTAAERRSGGGHSPFCSGAGSVCGSSTSGHRPQSAAIGRNEEFGYPVCTVCGQSVSPLSSERQREEFRKAHAERCRRPPEAIGFYANVTADALSLPACDDATAAYSVPEALRFGAARVLDMHMDDLQVLVIGHAERDGVNGLLWDPMPGGSGLLDQLCDRFEEIARAAREVVDDCPAVCGTSCIDCLQTFRNACYHRFLERAAARERFDEWGPRLSIDHDIPPLQPAAGPEEHAVPVNDAEVKLRHLLLAAGFGEGVRGEQLRLDRALGTTTPDVIYRAPDHDPDEGVCIYLDGLSEHLHGNPETAERDRAIRTWLRNRGYEVIEIAANELDDEDAMVRHFRRLASYLGMPETRSRVRDDRSWFRGRGATGAPSARRPLRLVAPVAESARYVNSVPFVPLQAAAGAFGDPQAVPDDSDWEWVEVDTARSLRPGMFVAQVVGKSMEPRIPDGAYCLFASPVTGTRQGRTVLVQLHDTVDPDTGQRFTVKRYRSEKTADEDGWRHVRIVLEPVNSEFLADRAPGGRRGLGRGGSRTGRSDRPRSARLTPTGEAGRVLRLGRQRPSLSRRGGIRPPEQRVRRRIPSFTKALSPANGYSRAPWERSSESISTRRVRFSRKRRNAGARGLTHATRRLPGTRAR